MRRGALWASAVPMSLGSLLLGVMVLGWKGRSLGGLFIEEDLFILSPVIAGLILGGPLAAWLSCRSLRNIEDMEDRFRWRSAGLRALISASLVHICVAVLSIIILTEIYSNECINIRPSPETSLNAALAFVSIHIAIWAATTLPLSLICATIFWRVTKFPDGRSVF